jgi:hypothetical protein
MNQHTFFWLASGMDPRGKTLTADVLGKFTKNIYFNVFDDTYTVKQVQDMQSYRRERRFLGTFTLPWETVRYMQSYRRERRFLGTFTLLWGTVRWCCITSSLEVFFLEQLQTKEK